MSFPESMFIYTFIILPVGFGLFCAGCYACSWVADLWTWLFHRNEEPKPDKNCQECASDFCPFHWVFWSLSPGHKDTPLVARVIGNAITLPFALTWGAIAGLCLGLGWVTYYVLLPALLVLIFIVAPIVILYNIVTKIV